MVTYIGLMSFTEKGAQSIKGTTQRAAAAKEMALKFGVTIKALYWTAGEYDAVSIIEAADDQSLAAFSLFTASLGNMRAKSLRAFDAAEMDQILAKLP